MQKPLKIIKKVASAKPAVAEPGVVTSHDKKPFKIIKPLSPRGQVAIQDILAGKRPGKAMLDAGFSPNTAKNPKQNLLSQDAAQKEIEDLVNSMKHHRDEVLEAMRESYSDASYSELSMALNSLIKNIQLLTGKATGKMGFDLPPEQADAIRAIFASNVIGK